MALDPRLVSPKEKPLFVIAAVLSALVWLGLIVSVVGIFYAAFFAVFLLVAQALFLAHVHGNGVRLSEGQLPELYARCKEIAKKLGLEEMPDIYVLQSHGVLNAFAARLLSRRFVVLYSSLLESAREPAQLELNSTHPLICKRVGALMEVKSPGTVPPVPRMPISYPLAPLFGFAAMGGAASSVLIIFAVMGMMAAIAVPNFIKFTERARAQAASQADRQKRLLEKLEKRAHDRQRSARPAQPQPEGDGATGGDESEDDPLPQPEPPAPSSR